MFGKHHTLKQLAGGIAIAASIAVVAVPSAFSSTSSRSGLITDTLGGNGSAKAVPDVIERYVATHGAQPTQVQGMRFITDTLGGNGHAAPTRGYNPDAYVYGGASPAVAKAIQDLGNGRTAAPSVTGGSGGTSFSWSDAGIGAGLAAGLVLLLLGGTRLRTHHRRGVLTV